MSREARLERPDGTIHFSQKACECDQTCTSCLPLPFAYDVRSLHDLGVGDQTWALSALLGPAPAAGVNEKFVIVVLGVLGEN